MVVAQGVAEWLWRRVSLRVVVAQGVAGSVPSNDPQMAARMAARLEASPAEKAAQAEQLRRKQEAAR